MRHVDKNVCFLRKITTHFDVFPMITEVNSIKWTLLQYVGNFLDLISAYLSCWMSISWSSMPSVVADSAKVRSILYLNVNEFFCQLRVTLCMRARVYMCESVGVGLWCRVCVCVYARLCWTRVQNAKRCTISTSWRYFYYDEHFLFFFFAADAALRRCAADAAVLRLFVCVYKNVGFAHFLFYFVFCKRKKTSGRILI